MHLRRVTPRDLLNWHYDEISASFRAGDAAMVSDWPGSYHLYRYPATCRSQTRGAGAAARGPGGLRAAYAGCHSFAIPRRRAIRGAAALVSHLTSFDARSGEARRGAIPCRASALAAVRAEAQRPGGRPMAVARGHRADDDHSTSFRAYPQCEDALWRRVQRAMTGEWRLVTRSGRPQPTSTASSPSRLPRGRRECEFRRQNRARHRGGQRDRESRRAALAA